jgi:biopolymer transport protein ExbB/TolQ
MNPQSVTILISVAGIFVAIIAYFLNRLIQQVDKITEKANSIENSMTKLSVELYSIDKRLSAMERDIYVVHRNGVAK